MSPVSRQEAPGEKIIPSRIYIGLDQLSAKQKKAILELVEEMGFAKDEVAELAIQIGEPQEAGSE